MTTIDFEEIKNQGVLARENGLPLSDNPYLHVENLPTITGELFSVWENKVAHWDLGWHIKDIDLTW